MVNFAIIQIVQNVVLSEFERLIIKYEIESLIIVLAPDLCISGTGSCRKNINNNGDTVVRKLLRWEFILATFRDGEPNSN